MKCRVMNKKQLDRQRNAAFKKLSAISVASMLMVCEKRHRFGYWKMRDAAQWIVSQFECINGDYITFDELKKCLAENDGVMIPFDLKTPQKCFTADDANRIAEYTEKAFACAVLCTVLTEKFGFRQAKAQQAVKQYCTIFAELKADRQQFKAYEKHLYATYSILLHNKGGHDDEKSNSQNEKPA